MAPRAKSKSTAKNSSDAGGKRSYTHEQVVAKKIADNFRSWGPSDTDVRTNAAGKTLRQVISSDLHNHMAGRDPTVMGALYYSRLRAEFRSHCGKYSDLAVADPSISVDPRLVKAIYATKRAHPERTAISAYLSSCGLPNQTELVGLCRYFVDLKPRCMKQLSSAMDALRFLSRLDIPSHFPTEASIIQPWMDEVLDQALARSRANKTHDNVFCDIHRPLLYLVMPSKPLRQVLACNENWVSVAEHITTLVESSQVGYRLFSVAVEGVMATRVAKLISDRLSDCFQKKVKLTSDQVLKHQHDTQAQVESLASIDLLPSRRTVFLVYRAETIKIKVQSVQEHVQLAYASALKSIAAQAGHLDKLWVEDLFVKKGAKCGYDASVPQTLFSASKAARLRLAQIISDQSAITGDLVRQVVGKLSKDLLVSDPGFKIELAIISELIDDTSGERMLRAILDCLPTATTYIAPEAAAQKLHGLRCSDWFKIADRGSQEKLKLCQSIVTAIVELRPPDLADNTKSEYMMNIINRLQYFLRCTVPKGSNEAGSTKLGMPAVEFLLSTASVSASADIVSQLKAFSWLLTPEQKAKVDALASAMAYRSRSDVGEAARKRQKKGPAAPSKGEADKAMQECLDIFK